MMIYNISGAVSYVFPSERILIPIPAMAPVDSAAISVVSAVEIPSRMAVIIKGRVAGKTTVDKISLSFAPRTFAALINVSSTLMTP